MKTMLAAGRIRRGVIVIREIVDGCVVLRLEFPAWHVKPAA